MNVIQKKILIVDDLQDNLQIMLNCLFEGGYHNILCATRGKDAIEIARTEIPDLILQDWDMPEISGLEVIRELKQHKDTRNIPVIIATGAMLESTDLDLGLGTGAVDYIRKPFDKIELLARIRSALEYADLLHTIEQQNNELIIQKAAMEKSRDRLQNLVNASEEAIVFVKEDIIRDVSDRFLAFSGYPYENIIGKSFLSLVPASEQATLLELERQETGTGSFSLLTVDERYIPCLVRINPFSFNGDSMQVLSIQILEEAVEQGLKRQEGTADGRAGDSMRFLTEINSLKATVDDLNRQLGSNTLREFQINEFIAQLSARLGQMKESRPFADPACRKAILEIIQEISILKNDRLWEEFKLRFNEIHPDFYRRLLHDFPSLTETDLRIMAFIKLNLTTKEIADITVQQINTIKAIRKRIRQKVKLTDRSDSLLSFIARY